MSKIDSISSRVKSSGAGRIPFVLAFTVAAFLASGAVYGARPKPAPDINAAVCTSISGVWAPHLCTILAGSNGVASTDFKIPKGNTLDVKGSLTVNADVTITNSGAIVVENTAGVIPTEFNDGSLMAGILTLGTIENSGTITIQNASPDTAGIAISVTVSDNPSGPNPLLVLPGVLTNSGVVTIRNSGASQGINNLGTLENAAAGTIAIANSLTDSVGIRNRRDDTLGSQYYIIGTMTNAGRITVANTGDGDSRGISNSGSFTNSPTGTFTINASTVSDVLAFGFRNNGSFTNFGTFVNNRGSYNKDTPADGTWGSYNIGMMVNYGRTFGGTSAQRTGTFFAEGFMINLGEITSYGLFYDMSGMMANFATFYNYGLIVGGGNLGICLDEPGSFGGC